LVENLEVWKADTLVVLMENLKVEKSVKLMVEKLEQQKVGRSVEN
jgi:hypothetical protein